MHRQFLQHKVPLILIVSITTILVFFIVHKSQWIYGDDFEFLITTAIGKIEWDFHLRGGGRFLPLCHFDYNILTLIPKGTTHTAHYVIVALSLIFFVFFSFIIYRNAIKDTKIVTSLIYWTIFVLITFLLYYFSRVFFHLIYPERIIIVLLSGFIITYYLYIHNKKITYLLVSIIIAIYTTYCKEPIFIIFVTIASLNLIFNYYKFKNTEIFFYLVLILNGIIFLSIYYLVSFRNTNNFYVGVNNPSVTFLNLLKFSFGNLKILWLGLLLAVIALFKNDFKNDNESLFYFTLMSAGLSYASACFILKLHQPYFYFPAIVLVFPGIVYFLLRLIRIEYLFAVMLILVLHYGKKFPNAIQNFQDKRSKTFSQMNNIISSIQNSYNCLWYIDPSKNNTQLLHKYITEVFIDHYSDELKNYKFCVINAIPDSISTHTIIFCEDNMTNHEILEKLGLRKMKIDQIWETMAYLK